MHGHASHDRDHVAAHTPVYDGVAVDHEHVTRDPAIDARVSPADVHLVGDHAIDDGRTVDRYHRTIHGLVLRDDDPAANADAPVAVRPVSPRRTGWRANGDAHDHGDGDYRTSTHAASFENRPHPGSLPGAPPPDNQRLR